MNKSFSFFLVVVVGIQLFVIAQSLECQDYDPYGSVSSSSSRQLANLPEAGQINGQIEQAINKGDTQALISLLEQPALVTRRGGGRQVNLSPATRAAKRNLERAQANLTWKGNTGRRYQAVAGLVGLLLGVGKGIYDLSLLGNTDSDYTTVSFSVATDLGLGIGSAYGIKLAIENGGAQQEYDKAIAMRALIAMAAKRQLIQPTSSTDEYFSDDSEYYSSRGATSGSLAIPGAGESTKSTNSSDITVAVGTPSSISSISSTGSNFLSTSDDD